MGEVIRLWNPREVLFVFPVTGPEEHVGVTASWVRDLQAEFPDVDVMAVLAAYRDECAIDPWVWVTARGLSRKLRNLVRKAQKAQGEAYQAARA